MSTAGDGRTLRVALLQLRAHDLADHERAWADLLRRVDEAGANGPDLVLAPEASYPAYYLHSREAYDAAGVLPDAEVEAALGERARRYGCAIAAGLVVHAPDGRLWNAAVLFAPSGAVQARQPKRFLWHFDREWFAPGESSALLQLETARGGFMICADGRIPEIGRSLAARGAEVFLDPTAWVSSGRDPALFTNPQVEYMLAARAIENGAWVLAADKVGTEAGTIVYAGRSGVIGPDGAWRVQAPADRPGIVRYTLDLDEAHGPRVARRPDLYGDARLPGAASEAARVAAEPLTASALVRVAAAAIAVSPSAVALMESARTLATTLATQGTSLLVLPDLAGADAGAPSQQELLPPLEALSAESGLVLVAALAERDGAERYKTVYVLDGGRTVGAHRQTHLDRDELAAGFVPGETAPPVIETRAGRLGLLAGSEALAPELARGLKLRGAELLAWCARPLPGAGEDAVRTLARSRAAEQRVFVVAAAGDAPAGGAYVVEPSGAVAFETPRGAAMAASADAFLGLARWHRMAPGTDPIAEHRPEAYPELFAATPSPLGSETSRT